MEVPTYLNFRSMNHMVSLGQRSRLAPQLFLHLSVPQGFKLAWLGRIFSRRCLGARETVLERKMVMWVLEHPCLTPEGALDWVHPAEI
jgi:hypothetical protein